MRSTLLVLLALGLVGLILPATQAMAGPNDTGVNVAVRPGAAAASKPDELATSRPDAVDRGSASPKELLEAVNKVTGNGKAKLKDLLGFIEPQYRRMVQMQLEMARAVSVKSKEVAKVVEEKIGKEQAEKFKTMGGAPDADDMELGDSTVPSPLADITKDGKIDWEKVKITEDADKAEVEVDGHAIGAVLKKVNGKWYVGGPEEANPVQMTMMMTLQKTMLGKMVKGMDQIIQKVKSGAITKDNFDQECEKILKSAMGGPAGGMMPGLGD